MRTHNVLSSTRGATWRAHVRPATSCMTFSGALRWATDASIRGGDVFEAVVRPDGSSSVLIADISSKGTPSIEHAAALRRAFRRAAHETNSSGRILSTLDALHVTGPLPGVVDGARHDECREPFEHGSLSVLATDRFSECRNTALDSISIEVAGASSAVLDVKRLAPVSGR